MTTEVPRPPVVPYTVWDTRLHVSPPRGRIGVLKIVRHPPLLHPIPYVRISGAEASETLEQVRIVRMYAPDNVRSIRKNISVLGHQKNLRSPDDDGHDWPLVYGRRRGRVTVRRELHGGCENSRKLQEKILESGNANECK